MSLDFIRLSSQERDQLARLKRHTGISTWNVLCRWAFCVSLAEPSVPTQVELPAQPEETEPAGTKTPKTEMTWRVFGGEDADIYLAILKQRCRQDGFDTDADTLATQFRLHLRRGISYLSGDPRVRSIRGLIQMVPAAAS